MQTRFLQGASERRRVRAQAARTLLQLHEAGALAEPERWTWDVLERLPLWCLLDEGARRRLQLCAGAVLLGPELRLWLERDRLDRVANIVGRSLLSRVLHEADTLAASAPASSPDAREEGEPRPARRLRPTVARDADAAALEAWLAGCGTAVLLGTLDADLPLGGLAASLGEPSGKLPAQTARALLVHAERLLVDDAAAAARLAPGAFRDADEREIAA